MKKLAIGLFALSLMFATVGFANAATTTDQCTCGCQKKCDCHCCRKGDCKCGADCKCTCPACQKSHESFVKKFIKCDCEK